MKELIIMLTISLYGNSVELGFFCIFRLFTFLEFVSLSNQRLPFSSLWTVAQPKKYISHSADCLHLSFVQESKGQNQW